MSDIRNSVEDENKAALEQLQKDKKEAAEFSGGKVDESTETTLDGDGTHEVPETKDPTPPTKVEDQPVDSTPQENTPKEGEPTPPKVEEEPVVDPKPQDPEPTPEPPKGNAPTYPHVPMDKYRDDKQAWQDEKAALESKITELEGIKKLDNAPSTPQNQEDLNKAVKAYAEKHSISEESVLDLVDMVQKNFLPQDKLEMIDRAHKNAVIDEETRLFDGEFSTVVPDIKKTYPNATDDQVEQVKNLLWEKGHTKEYFDKDLDYVAYKLQGDISTIMKGAEETKPGVKGPEMGNIGHGKDRSVKGADFKGKNDFSVIPTLPDNEQQRVINEMDPETRINYAYWMDQNDEHGIEVNRKGRKIILK